MVSLIILIHHFSTYRLDLFYDEIQLVVQLVSYSRVTIIRLHDS